MSYFALSVTFEYICNEYTDIINIFTLSVQGTIQTSESDVDRRQVLSSKVNPRAVSVKHVR